MITTVAPRPPKTLCFGAAHWDVIARARPVCGTGAARGAGARGRDVPGEVERRLGGVAVNVALGLTAAGVDAAIVTAVGDDADGRALTDALAEAGVDAAGAIRYSGAPTGRYVAIEKVDGELLAAVSDDRALDAMAPEHLAIAELPPADAWFVDANLPVRVIRALVSAPGRPPIFADAASEAKAPRLRECLARLDALYCNRREAEAIAAAGLNAARAAAESLIIRGARRAIVTDGPLAAADAGAHGVTVLRPGGGAIRSATGAGDALIAAHVAATLRGARAEDALAAGLAAAEARAA